MNIIIETKMNNRDDEYLSYLKKHIGNVVKTWNKLLSDFEFIGYLKFNNYYDMCKNHNIESHDASKYSVEEFEIYRKKYYPIKGEEFDEDTYKMALNHHYENNRHHTQFWNKDEDNLRNIPIQYLIEMFCDWISMSIFTGNSINNFWKKERDNLLMTDNDKKIIDDIYQITEHINFKD